jgi:hypothetical protein
MWVHNYDPDSKHSHTRIRRLRRHWTLHDTVGEDTYSIFAKKNAIILVDILERGHKINVCSLCGDTEEAEDTN